MTESRNSATGTFQVTARPLAAYRSMFRLTDDEITGRRLLDCPAGASPFGAQVRARGGSVVSADSIYRFPLARIEETVRYGIAQTPRYAELIRDTLDWNVLGSVPALVSGWETAADLFVADYRRHSGDGGDGLYVPADLPDLPFPDRSFDIAVSGFFLFFYSDVLDLDDHVRALAELTRVAAEVRVHPLVDSRGRPSPHLDAARETLRAAGIASTLTPSAGSDLRAAHRTLILRRQQTVAAQRKDPS